MTPEERAAAIAAAVGPNPLQYTFSGIVFSVSDCVASGPTVWVTVSAWTGTGSKKVFLPVDDRYGFTNPPLGVPDGGTATVTDRQGNQHTVRTYTRDDTRAAQQIVYDAVVAYALAHGWVP